MSYQTKEAKEWIKRIRLAKYKSLYLDGKNSLLMNQIEKLLLEDGFSKEQLQAELNDYVQNEAPNQDEVIKVKVDSIMYDLTSALEQTKDGSLNTNDHPEYYYRIQEVVAMDPQLSSQLLGEAIERMNIEYTSFHSEDLNGNDLGNYTYYFSKKS